MGIFNRFNKPSPPQIPSGLDPSIDLYAGDPSLHQPVTPPQVMQLGHEMFERLIAGGEVQAEAERQLKQLADDGEQKITDY